MTTDHSPQRQRRRREITALALAVPVAYGAHELIHIGGDQYGGALGLIAVAAVLDRLWHRVWTGALLYGTALAFLTDWTAMAQMLAWTAGA